MIAKYKPPMTCIKNDAEKDFKKKSNENIIRCSHKYEIAATSFNSMYLKTNERIMLLQKFKTNIY